MYERLQKSEVAKYYTEHYPKMMAFWQDNVRDPRPLLFQKMGIKSKRVLDLGCGNGLLVNDLLNDNDVHGVDISTNILTEAQGLGIKTILADFDSNFPFVRNYFDVILASDVLEHSFSPKLLLGRMATILNDNGVIYMTTPNAQYPNRIFMIQRALESALENIYGEDIPIDAKRFPDINILEIAEIRCISQAVGLEALSINGWSWKWEKMDENEKDYLWKNPNSAENLLVTLVKGT